MEDFSSSPVMEAFPGDRFGSPTASPSLSPAPSPTKTEVDADFPIDIDESFNSSMSFAFNDSPPQELPAMFFGTKSKLLPQSPTPAYRAPRRSSLFNSYNTVFDENPKDMSSIASRRPLGPSRTFGSDLTNTSNYNLSNGPNRQLFHKSYSMQAKGKRPPPTLPENTVPVAFSPPLKTALSDEDIASPRFVGVPRICRRDSAPTLESPVRRGDEMDIDSPAPSRLGNSDADDLGKYFEGSPAAAIIPTKRLFTLSSPPGSPSSSSPSNRRRGHDRSTSTSGAVFYGPRASTLGCRRDPPSRRRPPLQTAATDSANGNVPRASTVSAHPVLFGPRSSRNSSAPGYHRSWSMAYPAHPHELSDDDTDMDASPSVNMQRRHARPRPALQRLRTDMAPMCSEVQTAGVDGTMASGAEATDGPTPGREEEMIGKILPCHKVTDDGLMRITPATLCDLLAGQYNDKIGRYHIIDCRFDYEFNGGHVEDAINLGSEEHLDTLLLKPKSGINMGPIPTPSVSGELPSSCQNIIIFHCEFSLKRGPTFAKELRRRDRNLNTYPRLHYPEVYVLDGGYKSFFENDPRRCSPQGYVPMTDPSHASRCRSDMAEFSRQFGRTRSLTNVEPQMSSRCGGLAPPIALAAGTAAQGRRASRAARSAIVEELEPDSSPHPCASPTPRALSMGQQPLFGYTRPRAFERAPLQRYATDSAIRLDGEFCPDVEPRPDAESRPDSEPRS